jgi:hypothetical protein
MAITTLDGYIGAVKQQVSMAKLVQAGRTCTAGITCTTFDLAGAPGGGTLAGASTTAGVVPDSTVIGYPPLNAFGGGNTGYITRVDGFTLNGGRFIFYDRLFLAGAYAFNAAVTLSAQPSYSARVPNADYKGLEIWIEAVTGFTGNQSIVVTYTNELGVTGRTTGTIATGVAPLLGRCTRLPLQSGDAGVQKIESVTSTVSTVGTFNVMVLRPLCSVKQPTTNGSFALDLISTGMPVVYSTSALFMLSIMDASNTGVTQFYLDIANG